MTNLDTKLSAYQTQLDCLNIVGELLVKSRKGAIFHNTDFFDKPLDEAKRLLSISKEELADATVLSLLSAFEHTVFLHLQSSIRGKAHDKESLGGLNEAIKRFKGQVSPRTYNDTELLCRYRHWVAHGKRWNKPSAADPVNTHKCLTDFLCQAGLT